MCQNMLTQARMSGPTSASSDEFLSVTETAKRCSVHRKTVIRWIARGHLSAEALTPTSPYRIRRSDLEAFLTNARLGRQQRPTGGLGS